MIRGTITDKDRTDEVLTNFNGFVNLDNNGIGVVTITSPGEFGVEHITIGPGGVVYDVKFEMNLNPDPDTTAVWGEIAKDSRVVLDTDVYKWVSGELDSFKNAIKLSITNKSGSTRKIYFFVSASPRAQMPNRKY